LNYAYFKWFAARLSVMSWREQIYRARELILRVTYNPDVSNSNYTLQNLNINRLLNKSNVEYCEQQWNTHKSGVKIFSQDWLLTSDGNPEWYKFLNGVDTKSIKCFQIKFRQADTIQDDIRLVWELNRLVWLIPIAVHAKKSLDSESIQYVVKILSNYLSTEKIGFGARWGSSIEAAYQSMSLIVLKSILDEELKKEHLEQELDRAVIARRDFINRFPSLFSSANNHRLAELVALLIIESNTRTDAQILQKLSRELEVRTLEQFDAEGMNAELATDYHLSSFDLLLAVQQFVDTKFITEITKTRIKRIAQVTNEIQNFAEVWPTIGDSDSASFLSSVTPEKYRAKWLVGFSEIACNSQPIFSPTYLESGYSMAANDHGGNKIFLVADHGQLGFNEIAAHAHADTLAIWLWVNDRPWLIEAGTYSYHSSDRLRDLLRSSQMHNTISIGGMSTSKPSGPFLWFAKNRAVGKLNYFSNKVDGFEMEMEASIPNFTGSNAKYLFRRTLKLAKLNLEIQDLVQGTKNTTFASHFILSPEFELARGSASGETTFIDPLGNKISFQHNPALSQSNVDRVEVSKTYAKLQESYRISFYTYALSQEPKQPISIMLFPQKPSSERGLP